MKIVEIIIGVMLKRSERFYAVLAFLPIIFFPTFFSWIAFKIGLPEAVFGIISGTFISMIVVAILIRISNICPRDENFYSLAFAIAAFIGSFFHSWFISIHMLITGHTEIWKFSFFSGIYTGFFSAKVAFHLYKFIKEVSSKYQIKQEKQQDKRNVDNVIRESWELAKTHKEE